MDVEGRTDDAVLDEIVRHLVRELAPECIYLFGSRARGDAGPDSDYDLMVLVANPEESLLDLMVRARKLLLDLDVSADILVWERAGFDRRGQVVGSLPGTVLREGKVLYDAA